MEITPEPAHRSGFVSLVGRPNAGKSTLLNALLGVKIAIVADKPQTTRTAIQGALTMPGAQIVFVDTPGIHDAVNLLHKRMLRHIHEALEGRDVILFLADAHREFTARDEQALLWLKDVKVPVILVLNKIDLVQKKSSLLALIETYRQKHDFAEYIPISARTGEGLPALRNAIVGRLPEGPPYFPEDYLTDQPERFLAAELIREKILRLTAQEVPHSVAVLIDQWEEKPRPGGTPLTRILATVHVERAGQKKIIIGEGGSMLKRIGTEARQEIESLLDRKIYLELFVKVSENWRERAQFLNELDALSVSGASDDKISS
ncbi:MAG: GTPase Era [Bryobacteraceae bacterium]|nr:GTPase Era [Bryobacteraceae bacterium]